MAKKYALIIAAGDYRHSERFKPLNKTSADAQGMASILRQAETGGFDEVISLVDEDDRHVRIAVEKFFKHKERDDLLLLYFAGHGIRRPQGSLSLALVSTEPDAIEQTSIDCDWMRTAMNNSRSMRQLIILDCCFSGAFDARADTNTLLDTERAFDITDKQGFDKAKLEGRFVITATDKNSLALERHEELQESKHAIFTGALIEGFRSGKARDGEGNITVQSLYHYLKPTVHHASSGAQEPKLKCYVGDGDLIVVPSLSEPVPDNIQALIKSDNPDQRILGITRIKHLHKNKPESQTNVRKALLKLANDRDTLVQSEAKEVLAAIGQTPNFNSQNAKLNTQIPKPEAVQSSAEVNRKTRDKNNKQKQLELTISGLWARLQAQPNLDELQILKHDVDSLHAEHPKFAEIKTLQTKVAQAQKVETKRLAASARLQARPSAPSELYPEKSNNPWFKILAFVVLLITAAAAAYWMLEQKKQQDIAQQEEIRKALEVRVAEEKAAKEKAELEAARKAEELRLAKEKAAKEKAEQEAARKAEELRLAKEKAAKEKAEQEAARKAEELRLAKEKAAKEKAELEAARKAEELRLAKEKAAKEKAEREKYLRAGYVFQDKLKSGGLGPKMVVIPAGKFLMGSPASEPGRNRTEQPQQWISVSRFALMQTEVTFDDYQRFIQAYKAKTPDDEGWGKGKRPVINVKWNDAKAYADWLSKQTGQTYFLPSEAQWEYAARAGSTTAFSTGKCIRPDQANYNHNYPYSDCGTDDSYLGRTSLVATYAPNAFGLYDMHGNVWEWTEDCWHKDYHGAPGNASPWIKDGKCDGRVVRGGSWIDEAQDLRSADRFWSLTDVRIITQGFRLARTL